MEGRRFYLRWRYWREARVSLQIGFSGPLYQQVHESLKSKITNGEWRGGMIIPGDQELSRQLGVSIGTVRKALDELARQRLVVRERGRGTYIKDPSQWSGELETWLCGRDGRPLVAGINVMEAETVAASASDRKALQMEGYRGVTPRVHCIIRVWHHDERLICAERLLVNAMRLPALLEEPDLNAPMLSGIYERSLRKCVGRTVWSFMAHSTDAGLMERFGERIDDLNLVACRRVVYDASDALVEVSEQLVDLADGAYRISR